MNLTLAHIDHDPKRVLVAHPHPIAHLGTGRTPSPLLLALPDTRGDLHWARVYEEPGADGARYVLAGGIRRYLDKALDAFTSMIEQQAEKREKVTA